MVVQNFEDLIVWQKARELTRAIYRLTRVAPFAKDFGLVVLPTTYYLLPTIYHLPLNHLPLGACA